SHPRGVAQVDLQAAAFHGVSPRHRGRLVREDPYVHALGGSNQLLDGIPEEPIAPVSAQAMAGEDLGDALAARKFNDGAGRVSAPKYRHTGARLARGSQVAVDGGSVVRGEVGLADIDDKELPVEALLIALSARNHGQGIGSWRDADQDP